MPSAAARRLPHTLSPPSRNSNQAAPLPTALEFPHMTHEDSAESPVALANSFAPADIAAILRERGWLGDAPEADGDGGAALRAWLMRATELLGPQTTDRAVLAGLLALIFHYDASAILKDAAIQAVLAREGARDVIRELANRVLEGSEVDSDRLKEIVEGIKTAVPYRSRAIFHPIRVALAGRAGDGELDRVILLLDAAASLPFAVPVKGARQRMLEFCAALD
jgi:Anticodon binding domain